METVLLVIHLILAVTLVILVLLQRSEGGGLGLGGGGGMGGFLTARAAGNVLTRATAILATGFIITSLLLAILAGANKAGTKPTLQQLIQQETTSPATAPQTPTEDKKE